MREVALMNCLLSVYAKCGRVGDARVLFESLGDKDIVSWNSLINAYSVQENLDEVMNLFSRMRGENVKPDRQTFGSLASAVARVGNFEVGRIVHGQIVTYGFELDKHVGTSILALYSKCKKINESLKIFKRVGQKDVIFWTSMISGLVQNDSADKALRVFQEMLIMRVCPSAANHGLRSCGLCSIGFYQTRKVDTTVTCYGPKCPWISLHKILS
ncbi:pentatricopeptide repeat-containing protein at4g04370 [Phtheirospermum japonicum]|uniref:Pentatricopeptide repeat-containing protein at4g04370 n=1 Tax=Phtheirospermum japonicum TaxID=374723 RepID=A0A830CV17_9LAMI|nr:pentatricopeptide repeat-containing protein at4g04370 [Phtheirospermum japonicum]